MLIDALKLENYRGFTHFQVKLDPHFNLFVGDNASGKTSILDAIKIGLDSWFIGMKGVASIGSIGTDEVHMKSIDHGDIVSFEKQFPARVLFAGSVMGRDIDWERELRRDGGRTTTVGSKQLALIAQQADERVRRGEENVTLPLVCSYGTERLWYESPERKRTNKRESAKKWPSRFDGYRNCTAFEIQETDLLEWIREQVSAGQQRKSETIALQVIREAIVGCVEGAVDIFYDERYRDVVVVTKEHGPQLFRTLSDGQRMMISMIGDLAKRAITLNPHLGFNVLRRTPGVVTIDELDLHLHPRWQRRIIHDLKRIFASIQFIVTSHSPQLVGEALPHEIQILEDGAATQPEYSFGIDSSRILSEVMDAPSRNVDTDKLLTRMADEIKDEKLDKAQDTLLEIEQTLGEDDPEVTAANSLITLLKITDDKHP